MSPRSRANILWSPVRVCLFGILAGLSPWLLSGCSGPTASSGSASTDQPTAVTVDNPGDIESHPVDRNPTASEPGQPPTEDEIRIAAIERAVNETEAAQHECWAFAASDDFRLRGTMVIRLTFGPDHSPADVQIVTDEPGDARLSACIAELFQRYAWPRVFEPGQAIELPLSFRAPRGQYTVAARYVDEKPVAGGGAHAAVVLYERNTGNGAASILTWRMTGAYDSGLHRHPSSTELLYVDTGAITVYGSRDRRRGETVSAGHAVYIPKGMAHGVAHSGAGPTRVIQMYTPVGPEREFLGGVRSETIRVDAKSRRSAGAPIVARKSTTYKLAGGKLAIAFYFDPIETKHNDAYMGLLTAQPGAGAPPHRHAKESEYLFVLRGHGVTLVDGDPYPVAPGTAIQIPANTEHSFRVEGDQPLVAVQFYTPGGPEQRFKQPPSGN